MSNQVVIYHDNCHDGITALWVALKATPDAEPYPGNFNKPPDLELLKGKDVVIVDFSWKRQPMAQIAEVAATLRVLDHHATAEKELDGFADEMKAAGRDVAVVFDMKRSGAGIAWDELVGGERPPLIDYVEDRDIWKFELPNSREVHATCGSYPLTLEAREALMGQPIEQLIKEGESILRYHDILVAAAVKNALRETIDGNDVPSLCCPNIALASDIGHTLAKDGEPFSAVWVDKPDGVRYYGLRSTPEGLDVGEIATKFGGGGHREASGFNITTGTLLEEASEAVKMLKMMKRLLS